MRQIHEYTIIQNNSEAQLQITTWPVVDWSGRLQNSLILQETLHAGIVTNKGQFCFITFFQMKVLTRLPTCNRENTRRWVSPKSEGPQSLSPSVDVNMVRGGEHRRWPGPHCLPFWCLHQHARCSISSVILNSCNSWYFFCLHCYAIHYLRIHIINSFNPYENVSDIVTVIAEK